MTYPVPNPGAAFGPGAADRVPSSPHFPSLETEVLAFWAADDTFRASIANRADAPEWVFYDGPPFANGLPHYGHLLTGYAKDVFPRFQTMRGRKVDRRFGWDTHGLPAELEAERQLGITDKRQIDEMGIGAFNAAAKESVLRYAREWREYVTRQARWVDFDDDYKTLDLTFMESVVWAFGQLYEKGLAYEGYRVLPYCWRDQTPLSNHELRMDDDVYQMRQDPSVTVTFPLVGERAEALGLTAVRALAWTTTPWTLPTNAALAVGPGIEYAVVPAGPAGAKDDEVARESAGGGTSIEASVLAAEYLIARRAARRLREGPRLRVGGGCPCRRHPHGAGRRSRRGLLRPALRLLRRRRGSGAPAPRGGSSSTTTSRPRRAPASCTRPPPTERTTSACAPRRASPSSSRSTRADASSRLCPRWRGSRSSRRTGRSSGCCAPRGASCGRPATSTPTRTAGAAGTR